MVADIPARDRPHDPRHRAAAPSRHRHRPAPRPSRSRDRDHAARSSHGRTRGRRQRQIPALVPGAASIPVFHCVATYRDAEEIRANPGWRARAEDPNDLRNNVLVHNLKGSPG